MTTAPIPPPANPEENPDELRRQRLRKLEALRAQGIEPYPPTFHRTASIAQVVAAYDQREGQEVSVAGRIVGRRVMGRASFAPIQDWTGRIQLFLREENLKAEAYARFKDLYDVGDFVGATGRLMKTRTGEVSVEVRELTMLGKSLRPLPEKWHGLTDVEKRYRQRYLDLVVNPDARRVFEVRSALVSAIRRFMEVRGFIEIETPILQPLYGGALAHPFTTHHRALDRELYLRIATELYLKRAIVGGLDKVFEIGRSFRNEGIDTTHNPEFTVLESYEAYADYHDVLAMVEELVPWAAHEVLSTTTVTYDERLVDLRPPWQRISLRDAIAERTGIDVAAWPDAADLYRQAAHLGLEITPTSTRGKIIDELFSVKVQPTLIQPTFVVDYPVEVSPLAKRHREHPHLVERFEAFAGGLELANAFTELNDPLDQRARFTQQIEAREAGDEEAHQLDEDFIEALEHGMPPTGGLGIGIDRLVMLLTNQQSIREVILFPQLRTVK